MKILIMCNNNENDINVIMKMIILIIMKIIIILMCNVIMKIWK